MALDGAFLYLTAQEMRGILVGTRVEKIAQPSREELVMTFRLRGGSKKVLFSANAASPRVHFTEIALENPKSPPMFCMLLRKHIGAGKLLAIRQNGLDRVLSFDFETVNELGDVTVVRLTQMGKSSMRSSAFPMRFQVCAPFCRAECTKRRPLRTSLTCFLRRIMK